MRFKNGGGAALRKTGDLVCNDCGFTSSPRCFPKKTLNHFLLRVCVSTTTSDRFRFIMLRLICASKRHQVAVIMKRQHPRYSVSAS